MTTYEQFPSTYDGVTKLAQHLRGSEGCPWDREQTHHSLGPGLLEECYELVNAIEQADTRKMAEELGDVLFNLVLQIQIGREAGEFSEPQLMRSLVDKLVSRHPHVFGDVEVADSREVEANWEVVKRKEASQTSRSVLDGVPGNMPSLAYAQAIQQRAAGAKFDWQEVKGVLDKVVEELRELSQVRSQTEREQELGDLLFSMVNAARWLGVDAEGALRRANARFHRRFTAMEELGRQQGMYFPDLPMDNKETLWQEVKRMEGAGNDSTTESAS